MQTRPDRPLSGRAALRPTRGWMGALAPIARSESGVSSVGFGEFMLLLKTAALAGRPTVCRGSAETGSRARGPFFASSDAGRRGLCGPATKLIGCAAPLVKMPSSLAHAPLPEIRARNAEPGDIDALIDLEHRVFATDRLSRRSLQRFLKSKTAQVIVADDGERLAGAAVVLFRPRSALARLYSIATAPHMSGRGIGSMLLVAAEAAALDRDCVSMRLEVHETNHTAISRYRKSGYREFGRHAAYYDDGGDALRFEKRLAPNLPGFAAPPPYFHQIDRVHLRAGLHHDGARLGGPDRSGRRRRLSFSSGAKPPPSSWVPGRAAAGPSVWRWRSSVAGCFRKSTSAGRVPIFLRPRRAPTSAASCK